MFYLVIDLKYFIQKIVWMCHVIWHRMILEYIDIAEVKLPCPRNNFWKRFAISRLTSVKLRCITNEIAIARFDNTCNLYNNIHNLVNEQTLKKHYLHLSSIPRLLFRIDWFRCTTRTAVSNGWRHVWKYFASGFIKWFRKKNYSGVHLNNGWRHIWKYFASCFIKLFRKKILFWRSFKCKQHGH